MIMCRACGEFTTAKKEDGIFVPIKKECPACGGTKFKRYGSKVAESG